MAVYTGHDCLGCSTDYDGYILITVLTTAVLTKAMITTGLLELDTAAFSSCIPGVPLSRHALYAFQVYLRNVARKHVLGQANAADIEKDVKRVLGIDLTGKLAELQAPMDKSKAIYERVHKQLRTTDGFQELLEVLEIRNADLTQVSDEFDTVYKQAPKAQQRLTSLIASEWQADPNMETVRHPVPCKQQAWVDSADDPGVKGESRSLEKMQTTTATTPTSSRTWRGPRCATRAVGACTTG